ncbi:MAG TPA: hypothetical protein VF731_05160 [Solirubrobacterales bacterium]
MPTKNAKASTGRSKAVSRAAKQSGRGALRKGSRDSPASTARSSDRRTTLRVPRALDTEVSRVSRELGISGNEALVRLAARGAESARREREVRRVIERRHAAVMESGSFDASAAFPSEREIREAILADRD